MKRICALLCCILVLTLFVPARAQEGWGFTGASFFEALELAVLRYEGPDGFDLLASGDEGERWTPATGLWADEERREIEVPFAAFSDPILLSLHWGEEAAHAIRLYFAEDGRPSFQLLPALIVEVAIPTSQEIPLPEPAPQPEEEAPPVEALAPEAVEPDHPQPPGILYQDAYAVVFAGGYLIGLAREQAELTLTRQDANLRFPAAFLDALNLGEEDRLAVEVRRPTEEVFTLRLVRNGSPVQGTFSEAFTVSLPWQGEHPQCRDESGNLLPVTLREGVVYIRVNAPGSFVLREAPPAPANNPEAEEIAQAIALPALAGGLLLAGAIAFFLLGNHRRRCRLYSGRKG